MSENPKQNMNPWEPWQNEVNALCNELFFNNPKGTRLLALWEQRYFYAPVLDPSKDIAWGHNNEGRNNFIRGIRACAYAAMQGEAHIAQLQKETDHGENV